MIQKGAVYISGSIKFVNFIQLSDAQKIEILNWRNNELIRKWMFNKEIIKLNSHLNFIQNLVADDQNFYWLALKSEEPIGVININQYDVTTLSAVWGFYLNPALFMSNLGFELFYETIRLFFEQLKLNELKGYVQTDNTSALILNDFFGMKHSEFVSIEGVSYSFRQMYRPEWNGKQTLKEAKKEFIQFVAKTKHRWTTIKN